MSEADPPAAADPLALTVSELLTDVAAPTPAPGAGAVTATVVALAAGLTAMSAGLSRRRLPEADELVSRAEELQAQAGPLGRRDAEVYAQVLVAMSRPQDDAQRPQALRTALEAASDVPLQIARTGLEVVDLATQVSRRGNPNLRGDALTAVLLARAAVRAAALLVGLNLKDYPDDPRWAEVARIESAVRTEPGGDSAVED